MRPQQPIRRDFESCRFKTKAACRSFTDWATYLSCRRLLARAGALPSMKLWRAAGRSLSATASAVQPMWSMHRAAGYFPGTTGAHSAGLSRQCSAIAKNWLICAAPPPNAPVHSMLASPRPPLLRPWTAFFSKPGRPGLFRKGDKTLRQSGAIYLQYGCGQSCPGGSINFDASPTLRLQRLPVIGRLFKRGATVFPDGVRFGDIVRGLPIPDGSVQGIYASHVLEHLSYADFWRALDHTFRLLRPGGIFRLVVPDLKSRAQKYVERLETGQTDANSWFWRSARLGSEGSPRGPVALARSLIGRSAHLWMWDEISLAA